VEVRDGEILKTDPDWVSHSPGYAREMGATMIEIGKTGPFWLPEKKP